jgi:hypothetical protein
MLGSLTVCGGSSPVERCLALVLAHVAGAGRRCPLMHAGDPLVRVGRPAERRRAGGQQLSGGSLRHGRVAQGCFQPVAGRGVP